MLAGLPLATWLLLLASAGIGLGIALVFWRRQRAQQGRGREQMPALPILIVLVRWISARDRTQIVNGGLIALLVIIVFLGS